MVVHIMAIPGRLGVGQTDRQSDTGTNFLFLAPAGSAAPPISAFWPGLGELQAYSRPAVFRAMRILRLRRGRRPSVPAPNTKLHPRPPVPLLCGRRNDEIWNWSSPRSS
eukprot:gene20132-biopygen20577